MQDAASIVQWQIDLSSAVQDLLAAAVCIDVKNWTQAQKHIFQSQDVCDRLINALEERLELMRLNQPPTRNGNRMTQRP